MAGNDLDSGAIKKRELDDMTTCCICTEVFTDPKALPCIHTFCMKCIQETGLKTNKGPGDEMPCPICRRMFHIPPEGFCGLPKNFFIENLILVANVSDQSAGSRALCDACLDESKEDTGKEIPAADTYCVDCNQKFCEECCRLHRKLKLTKNHKLMQINEYESGQNVMTNLAPSTCELHEQNIPNVYCADCKTVVCANCFIDDHKNHEGSHVKKFVDGFRKQIESKAEVINECRSKAETKKAHILKVKDEIQVRVKNLESLMESRIDEVKQFTDKHATFLLQSLSAIRQSKIKEIQMTTCDIDTYLSCLDTYNFYCQKIITKGSASDICRSFSDLSVRAVELQEQCQPITESEIQSFNFCFRKSELEEFLDENCDNLIGEIEEEDDLKPKERSKQSVLAEKSNEIDQLRKKIEIERTDNESVRFANEQLRININKEIKANKAMTEELSKEKDNYDAHIKKLERMLDNNKVINNTLQGNNDTLKQELDIRNMTIAKLQTNNDKLNQELDKEKIANNTLRANNDKLQQELDAKNLKSNSFQAYSDKLKQELENEKTTNNFVQASNNRIIQEVSAHKMTIKTLENSVEKLKQELETTKTEERDLKPENRSEQNPLAERRTEIDLLRKENRKLKQELETTKADSRNMTQDLEQKRRQEQSEKEQLLIMRTEEKQRLFDQLRYKSDPVLVVRISTKAATEERKAIVGLAILDKDLYIVNGESSEVEVYDSSNFCFSRRWNLKELIYPWDIVSCNRNKCLYIFDFKGFGQSKEILRVGPNGKFIKNWSTEDDYGRLSVTDGSNVILSVYEKNKVIEYSPDGQLIYEIILSLNVGLRHLFHAIKLSNGHFVVSHGYDDDELHRVCIIDADGNLRSHSVENLDLPSDK